jgi:hypothetical protein
VYPGWETEVAVGPRIGCAISLVAVGLAVLAPGASARSARADFNGDGFEDLAIGVPGQDVVPLNNGTGAVHVLYGSRERVRVRGNQLFTDRTPGMRGSHSSVGRFGAALAAGDFDGDGFDDLAIGAPDATLHGCSGGTVHVLYGSAHGLKTAGNQVFNGDTPRIAGDGCQNVDEFGFTLAAGHFDRNARDDLAIGAPGEDLRRSRARFQGAVSVLYGHRHGLNTRHDDFFTQDTPGVKGTGRGSLESFGYELAAGDLDRSGIDDLAIGVPLDNLRHGKAQNAGGVNVLYGRGHGLSPRGDDYLNELTLGMEGNGAEAFDEFGSAVAIANFGRGKAADLAIGEQREFFGHDEPHGAVHVLYGSRHGVRVKGNQLFTSRTKGLDIPRKADVWYLGSSLAAGPINGDDHADLAMGAPGTALGPKDAAGAVSLVNGSRRGLTVRHAQFLTQDTPGLRGDGAQGEDEFGASLALQDLNGDGFLDLSVGAPVERIHGRPSRGAVSVLYSDRHSLRGAGSQFLSNYTPGLAGDGDQQPDGDFGAALISSHGGY